MEDLAVEVGKFHPVTVGNSDAADPAGSEIVECRTAKPPRADNENTAIEEFRLPLLPDLRDEDMPAVNFPLRSGE